MKKSASLIIPVPATRKPIFKFFWITYLDSNIKVSPNPSLTKA